MHTCSCPLLYIYIIVINKDFCISITDNTPVYMLYLIVCFYSILVADKYNSQTHF